MVTVMQFLPPSISCIKGGSGLRNAAIGWLRDEVSTALALSTHLLNPSTRVVDGLHGNRASPQFQGAEVVHGATAPAGTHPPATGHWIYRNGTNRRHLRDSTGLAGQDDDSTFAGCADEVHQNAERVAALLDAQRSEMAPVRARRAVQDVVGGACGGQHRPVWLLLWIGR